MKKKKKKKKKEQLKNNGEERKVGEKSAANLTSGSLHVCLITKMSLKIEL